jgi:carbon monoxide dehydrogenase subunit G
MFPYIREIAVVTGERFGARRFLFVLALLIAALPGAAQAQGQPQVIVSAERGVYTVAAAFTVKQPVATVIGTLTDYDRIPRFMPEIEVSIVRERGDHSVVVEQEATARFMLFSRRVHLVLDVQLQSHAIRFQDRCGKSFVRYQGAWVLTEQGDETTITYELSANPRFEVPEFLLKRLMKRDAVQMIARLKREMEARARETSPIADRTSEAIATDSVDR